MRLHETCGYFQSSILGNRRVYSRKYAYFFSLMLLVDLNLVTLVARQSQVLIISLAELLHKLLPSVVTTLR